MGPCSLQVSRLAWLRRIIVRIPCANLTLAIHKHLGEVQSGGDRSFHDSILVRNPSAGQRTAATENDVFSGMSCIDHRGIGSARIFRSKSKWRVEVIGSLANPDMNGAAMFGFLHRPLRSRERRKRFLLRSWPPVISGRRHVKLIAVSRGGLVRFGFCVELLKFGDNAASRNGSAACQFEKFTSAHKP